MNKSAIYYTDFHVNPELMEVCLRQLKKAYTGEIVSVTLDKPLDLGKNIVLKNEERSYPTMIKQIITGLENLTADYVYFLEHDILYGSSHFDFTPTRDDIFYYNVNNWRWFYPEDRLITYKGLTSLSMLCCNRELALNHYRGRLAHIQATGLDQIKSREPKWARKMGYEPGTKPKRRGGFSNETHDTWRSALPNIDIRHRQTFSPPKVNLQNFKHLPEAWQEAKINEIPGWDLQGIMGL